LFINLIYELIVFGFMRCVSSPTNCGGQFAWAGDVKDSQIIIGSAAVYTARPTFSLFDICICFRKFVFNLTYFTCSTIHPNFYVNLTQDEYVRK